MGLDGVQCFHRLVTGYEEVQPHKAGGEAGGQGRGVPVGRGRAGWSWSAGQFCVCSQLPRPMESEWKSSMSVLVIIVRDQILMRDRKV